MAGEWIKMRLDLADDPAVIEIADELGIDEQCVVGYLHAIWSWANRHCNDGSVTGVTLESLSRVTRCGRVPELMVQVGWLEVSEIDGKPVLHFPNWERHNSQSAKSRAVTATRVRQHRQKSGNGHSVTQALPEKRRVEKSIKVDTNVSTCGDPAGSPPQSADATHSEFGFPTRNGQTWYLPNRKLEEYRDSYGDALDLPAEFAKAREWLRANKLKRKTATGMPKFLTGWLNRACDRAPPAAAATDDPDAILRERRAKRRAQTSDTG